MESVYAAIPLYDLPEAREQTDALWKGFAHAFREVGFQSVPDALLRGEDVYRKPLFFGQVCGYPLTHEFSGRFQVLATPVYRTPLFSGPEYSSVIAVHRDCKWEELAEARDSRVVINSRDSHSGYNILRSMISPLSEGKPFFRKVSVSGGHRKSLFAVSNKQSDLASIDCLTWSLLERYAPETLEKVRILELTPPAPAPPFVTEQGITPKRLKMFRTALRMFFEKPELKREASQLFLTDVLVLPGNAYDCILRMEHEAVEDL